MNARVRERCEWGKDGEEEENVHASIRLCCYRWSIEAAAALPSPPPRHHRIYLPLFRLASQTNSLF